MNMLLIQRRNQRWLLRCLIAHAHQCLKRLTRHLATEIVHVTYSKFVTVQRAGRPDDECVACGVNLNNVQWLAGSNTQALALPNRIVSQTTMASHLLVL